MKGLVLSLFLVATHSSPAIVSSTSSSDWKLNGELSGNCMLATLGNVNEMQGAQLTIQCAGDTALTGNVMLKLPAANLQYKRITVTAEVEHDSEFTSTLWMKSLHDNRTLLFDSDVEQTLLGGNDEEGQRSISAVVAKQASSISLGLMLHGKGSVTLRNVHISFSSEGEISPQAQAVLGSALKLIRLHSVRTDVDWSSLNAQAQLFAAGATNSADVYPVIRYVLQQLGDQRSMVLTPRLSQALNQRPASVHSSVQIYSLPDGADLVLANSLTTDQRIADR